MLAPLKIPAESSAEVDSFGQQSSRGYPTVTTLSQNTLALRSEDTLEVVNF